ncbi:MAG: hypothetical protein ABJO28_14380 [Maribacter dokdonensis]|uniref:hypothetical protein n=1 Tax=Maribacter dokdonensis TaxID=320912 RepID=UPI001C08FD2C|nr:hypothetical protein [Maribacter dokdonensis]MBU2902234.1 hypothetical protein [Maribacter dokdonensis]MDP2524940.1 hypothetical protein [Maribacter dokdonensis]
MKFNPFEYFEIRNDKSFINQIESEFVIELPPMFKLFNETFILKSFKNPSGFFLGHPDEEIGFDTFNLSIDFLMKSYNENYKHLEIQKDIFPIASSGIHQFGICVGLTDNLKDKICVSEEINDWKLRIIGDNIFDFIKDFQLFDHQKNKTYANTVYKK